VGRALQEMRRSKRRSKRIYIVRALPHFRPPKSMESTSRQRSTTGAPENMINMPPYPEHPQNDGTNSENRELHDQAPPAQGVEPPVAKDEPALDSRFKMRHIATMMFGDNPLLDLTNGVGLSIGTGVLFDSGYPLWIGGPVCLILAYCWAGSIQYCFTVLPKLRPRS